MNYKITTGIFAATTLILIIALGYVFRTTQPDMRDGFPGGGFPGGDFTEGEFGRPPFGDGQVPGDTFCECPDAEDEDLDTEDEEVPTEETTTEDTEEAL